MSFTLTHASTLTPLTPLRRTLTHASTLTTLTPRAPTQLREDKERGIFIDKARSIYVSSPEEMMEVIAAGAENRELSATGMNA